MTPRNEMYELLKAADTETMLSQVIGQFRLAITNARCYICEEKIGDARWHVGEYVSGNKEVVHTECYDEEAERAQSQESYWCGSSTEEVHEALFGKTYSAEDRAPLGDTRCGWTPKDGDGSGTGQPARKAETNPCAAVVPDRPFTEAHLALYRPRGHAVEDLGGRHQRNAKGPGAPADVPSHRINSAHGLRKVSK